MSRTAVVGLIALADLLALGVGVWSRFIRTRPIPDAPTFIDDGARLPTSAEFEELVKTDAVRMFEACLKRYQRECNGGFTATLVKRERVQGKPAPPAEPHEEVISLSVRGDIPDATTGERCIEVLMKWQSGARTFFNAEIRGTLYSDKPGNAGTSGKVVTWRPTATLKVNEVPAADPFAQAQSRYCIRDAGIYRGMLRTYDAWKQRKEAGVLRTEYVGKTPIAALDGRVCYVVDRTCESPDVDAFELGGVAKTDSKTVANEGFTRVRVMIDAETWLQIGTELYRPDGHLLAAYYFRNPNITPTFADDTFTLASLKR